MGKRKVLAKNSKEENDVNSMEAARIVNEQVDAQPRLKAAREVLKRARQSAAEDNFVQETLKSFRQRLKD